MVRGVGMRASQLRQTPLGTRLVVRYRLHDAEHGATDALGELVAIDALSCTIATRRGQARIALSDIIAAKQVPPPPPRRRPRV